MSGSWPRASAVTMLLALLGAACRVQSAERTPPDLIITGDGLATVRVCARLDTIAAVFDSVRDTLIESEGLSWPAKVVTIGDGDAVFSSSWSDTVRVWTIIVSSPSVRTRRGYSVGMTVGSIMRAGEVLTAHVGEGMLSLQLAGEHIGAQVDDAAETAFLTRFDPATEPRVQDVPSDARIRALFTLGGCQPAN